MYYTKHSESFYKILDCLGYLRSFFFFYFLSGVMSREACKPLEDN